MTGEAHSADAVTAKEFPDILKGIIEEGEYHPDAIYNTDEAGLQYKRMPKSTFLAKQVKHSRGHKADKSRFTVLFCVNATGTHKVKPLVVHTAKHSRCYQHLQDMKAAPVYWRASRTLWLTSLLTKDCLLNCFVPKARRKCREDGRPFDVLLTMDNCPAHPEWLMDIHPNVQVVFLPPNTTSLLQPLDQEVIATVKARYHATVYRQLRHATESNDELRQILAEDSNADGDNDIATVISFYARELNLV